MTVTTQMPRLVIGIINYMIKFKLCKQFNTVEIEFDNLSEIDSDLLDAVYEVLPDYKGEITITEEEKPSEAQLKYAKGLGIVVNDKMSKSDLWRLINAAKKK